ncbi:MAG: ABC transporter substrate-binding protein [Bacillati bacterium ANGP1]|uniref:ABC transporter substrate-binding protein n=1 Tax=Candidatus Segetimicrobium genomatis TaxID=2569760 RepID=A0A537KCX1_9BACT|nr:MAG: ABC transporter substrate-binding protein [Terrabacteria group bacterium ANGP1]
MAKPLAMIRSGGVSMKRIWTVALAVLLAVPVSFTMAVAAPQPGGTLVYALRDEPDRLDPNLSGLRPSQIVFFQIFDPLIVRDKTDKKFKPWLATSWTVSPDGTVYTFKLRQGVKFHDGTPFDAAAVKFNFDRTHNPSLASRCGGCAVGFYDHAQVVDPSTVKIYLKRSWAPFLDAASLYYRMVSPAGVKQYGDQDFGRHPVGSGPFKFVEWIPNDHITLERYGDYQWPAPILRHSGPAYVERVIIRMLPEDSTRVAALENGEVQVIDNAPAQDFDRLTKDSRFKALVGFVPGVPFDFAINVTKPPTDELAVRQALSYGLDRPTIVKTVFGPFAKVGAFLPAYGLLTPYTYGYDKSADVYRFDPAKARTLLDDAGWKVGPDGIRQKAGKRLIIPVGSWEHGVPEVMQAQLKQIGIDLRLFIATGTAIQTVNENQRKAVTLMSPLPAPRSDPDIVSAFLHSRNVGGGGFNFSFVSDPALDRLLDAQAVEVNEVKRAQILSEAQHMVMEKAYMVAVYNWDNISLKSSKVNDLEFDSIGFFPWLHDAWLSP